MTQEQTQCKEIIQYYEIKSNAKDPVHPADPSRIHSRIRDFVKEQNGLEVAVEGNYVEHDSTPESYPYGNPNGTTYNSKMEIYHVQGCTIKVYGDYITTMNYPNSFFVLLYGKEQNVQDITKGLDEALNSFKS